MKYLSLGILVAALAWTWTVSHQSDPVSEGVHVGIQDDLKKIIADYIQKNLPTAKDVRFEKMWSEKIKDTQVKASFVYSFEDQNDEIGAARVQIEGYAILNREQKPDEQYQVWSFDELYILNNHVVFKDGITVGPGAGPDAGTDEL